MQLFLNATSPFARLARVVALEKGLADQLKLVWCDPWSNDPALLAAHPQLRIPVLLTDSGHAISESLLITQYLDHIGLGPALVLPAQMADILARTSVAYGLMEAAFGVVIGRKNEGAEVADATVMGQRRLAAMARVLRHLEDTASTSIPRWTLDMLCTAIALEYVRFRLPALLPAASYPRLHAWLAQAAQHPHLRATQFVS